MYVDMMAFPDAPMKPQIFADDFPRPAVVQITAAPPSPRLTRAEDILAEVRKTTAILEEQDGVSIVYQSSDLEQIGDDEIKVVLGLQQPPFNATAENIKVLSGAGIQLSTLAYKEDENPFGGGFLSDRGLTDAGKMLLDYMNVVGMWFDASHGGHTMIRQALDYLEQTDQFVPVLASHTGCYDVYNFSRNLPDDILRRISENWGLIGLYTLSFGLHPTDNSLAPFLEHLDHLLEVCGADRVALGTDGTYQVTTEEERAEQFQLMKLFDSDGKMRSRIPVESLELNDIRKDIRLKAHMLKQFGPHVTNGVMSDNALEFLRRNLQS